MRDNQPISVLGAGLAGSLLALMLRKAGFPVSVFEKRIDPRHSQFAEGKSINLALSHRGIQALRYAGIFPTLEKLLIPMKGRMMHSLAEELTVQPYGKEGQYINSISRNELNKLLIEEAESQGVEFHFGHKCVRADIDSLSFVTEHNRTYKTHTPFVLVGADGAFSSLRGAFQMTDRFDYSQEYVTHGYKELSMPSQKGSFAMSDEFLHIWPRGKFMLIALPNPDKTFTCTLFFPFNGTQSFDSLQESEDINHFFKSNFPDAYRLIPDIVDQFSANQTSSLVTIKCAPWNRGRALLVGDAAHAIVPFYGQGMNAAFEDCRLLCELGESMNFDWERLPGEFAASRKPDADAISELALLNFLEMRDDVGDEKFLERKKIDAALHVKYGDQWIPMYTMVTFTDIPYRQALETGQKQQRALIIAQQEGFMADIPRIFELFQKL